MNPYPTVDLQRLGELIGNGSRSEVKQVAGTAAIRGAEARERNRGVGHAAQNCGPTVLPLSFVKRIPRLLDQGHLAQVVNVPVRPLYGSKVVGES